MRSQSGCPSPRRRASRSASHSSTIPAVSPDGRRVAFSAARAGTSLLWVRSLDSLEVQPLPGTENGAYPFWSPDSHALGFFVLGATLKIIDAAGGPVRTLCDVPGNAARGGSWNADGVILFGSASGGLFTVSAMGGAPMPLTAPDASHGESAHSFPSFLPDGRHFLYWATPSNMILLGSFESKERTRLLMADSQGVYVTPGSLLLFVRQGTLMAQHFDARRVALTGEAMPLSEQLLPDSGGGSAFAVSATRVLAYRTATLDARTELTWVDPPADHLAQSGHRAATATQNCRPTARAWRWR